MTLATDIASIDTSKPSAGAATTLSVRDNFTAIKSALQNISGLLNAQGQQSYTKETTPKQASTLISTSLTALPTTTGGVEVFSVSFTPNSDTSKLLFEYSLAANNLVSTGQMTHFLVAMFKNSDTTATVARAHYPASVGNNQTVAGKFEIASTGKDVAVTFKFRIGSNQVNNVGINIATSNYGGAANFSELWITEIER